MPRVVHFEIHAGDPQRAIKFYSELFGWQFSSWGGKSYWLIKTGEAPQPGIDGGLMPRRGEIDGQAVIAFVCTVDVSSVDEYADKVVAGGGQMVVPKMAVPGVGWLAYGKDTEGNIFGLMQMDPAAA